MLHPARPIGNARRRSFRRAVLRHKTQPRAQRMGLRLKSRTKQQS